MIKSKPAVVVPAGVPGTTKSERVRAMFSQIVPRYDMMNRLMTLGMDAGWRRAAVEMARPRGLFVLDVGTGTGDLAISLVHAGARAVVGLDFVEPMLDVARSKTKAKPGGSQISLANGDAMHLPFPDNSFDCVTSAFLLRNVEDIRTAVGEMVRVLRPGGRCVCLEITHSPPLLRPGFALYFGRIVPIIGSLLTGEAHAYRYLPASLGPLPDALELASILRDAGLRDVGYRRVGLGTVAIHIGTRRTD